MLDSPPLITHHAARTMREPCWPRLHRYLGSVCPLLSWGLSLSPSQAAPARYGCLRSLWRPMRPHVMCPPYLSNAPCPWTTWPPSLLIFPHTCHHSPHQILSLTTVRLSLGCELQGRVLCMPFTAASPVLHQGRVWHPLGETAAGEGVKGHRAGRAGTETRG